MGVEEDIIEATNAERQRRGLHPLCKDFRLMNSAAVHAQSMANADRLDHDLGDNPGQRMRAAGYTWTACSENIAWNYTADRVVTGWMNSPGHRRNILDPRMRDIGVGVVMNSKGEPYYCQNFASD